MKNLRLHLQLILNNNPLLNWNSIMYLIAPIDNLTLKYDVKNKRKQYWSRFHRQILKSRLSHQKNVLYKK